MITCLRYVFRITLGITILGLLLNGSTTATTLIPTDYDKIQLAIDNTTPILKSEKSGRFDINSLKYEHEPGELLVKYSKKLSKKDLEKFYTSQNMTLIRDYPGIGYHLIRVDESSLENTMEVISQSDKFENVEPNYVVKAIRTPNDSRFNELWAMNNKGQAGGTPDADIDAPEAWNITTGSRKVVVAVIDTGVDYTHEDLAKNMWKNPGEIPGNGIDDDNNGFIDDYYGWDFAYDDNDPMDGNSHGTHVSGTIGGVGNNGKGVTGVSWNVRIMAVKFLNDYGSGSTSDAIDAINYATMMGVDIMSNSWGGGGYSSALKAAIQAADDAGILFVAAAGNEATNTDKYPFYPSGYNVPNVMSITATDQDDNLASFSNYGTRSVDIGAPGVDILSSVPGNRYSSSSGTSMATSHVSGAAALLKASNSSLTHLQIKKILMNNVDPLPSLYGKTVTGGRLNIHKAFTYHTVCPIGCYYTSIQTAIDAANPGDTIVVRNGTYYENVNVNKQLTLRGIGSPVVDAKDIGSPITLSVDGIKIEGFTAIGGCYDIECAGIVVTSNNNTLTGNKANSNRNRGIWLHFSNNNKLTGNNANSNGNIGIYMSSSSNNMLIGNNANRNYIGISPWDSNNNNTLINNNASKNSYGIYLYSYNNNNRLISNNVYSNNRAGIRLDHNKNDNNLIYNNIFNNTENIQFMNSNINIWNITKQPGTNIIGGFFLGGNFWAHPNGTGFSQACPDSNKDGICDIQYTLDSYNIDYLPLAIVPTGITVVSPNGGESWGRGTTHVIRWTYTGNPGTGVKISLLKNDVQERVIASSTSNDGIYNWSINSTQLPGTDYKIKVTSTTNSSYKDYSDGNFSIYDPSLGAEKRITTNPLNQFHPSISKNRIVWYDYRNGNSDIYLYDLSTGAEKRITSNASSQILPDIDGKRIVWQDMRDGNWEIYMYNLSTGTEKRITKNSSNQTYPSISGNRIVWADNRNGNTDIYMYNLSTGTEKRITTNTAKQDVPVISGNRIVWEDKRNGNRDIYMYDLSTGTEKRITTNASDQNNPDIDGKRIVWYDNRKGNLDIYMYNISTGIEERITTNTSNQLHPSISGNRIVWEDNRNGNPDIYLYDLSTKTTRQVTSNTASQWFPAISGTRIVWYDNRNVNTDIYMYTVAKAQTPSIRVVSPNGGERWTRGTIHAIRWTYTGSTGRYVKIALLKNGLQNRVITSNTSNDGSYNWSINSTQTPGADYKIRVTSTNNPEYTDKSNGNFTIRAPGITVTSPNGGERWTRGTIHAIRWTYTGSTGRYVKIDLLKNGLQNRVIASNTSNDGSYNWPINLTQTVGADYKIKVTSTTYPEYTDKSNDNFSINDFSIGEKQTIINDNKT